MAVWQSCALSIIEIAHLWDPLIWPLIRLLLGLAAGLLLANILECLRWTDYLALLARPLARLAHLGPESGSAFALAFVSPAAANSLLAESYENKKITRKELVMANLFNSLPANLAHLPTIFFLTWPILDVAAFVYTGLSLLAAISRTIVSICIACVILPMRGKYMAAEKKENDSNVRVRFINGLAKAWKRFCKRMPKLAYFTIPFYVLIYLAQECGLFKEAEAWLAAHLAWLTVIKPEAMSIVVLQIVAEMGASLGAAGAIIASGSLSVHDVVAAMLAGNLLSTPMRAIRHQFPAYAGFFRPPLAITLIIANQSLRAASMAIILAIYVYVSK